MREMFVNLIALSIFVGLFCVYALVTNDVLSDDYNSTIDTYMFILEERVGAPDYIETYNATGNRTIDIGFNNDGFITEIVFRCDEGFIQKDFYCEERLEV